jgi:hypothetical protein
VLRTAYDLPPPAIQNAFDRGHHPGSRSAAAGEGQAQLRSAFVPDGRAPMFGNAVSSDSRCAALDFSFGSYEPPCRDDGNADGLSRVPHFSIHWCRTRATGAGRDTRGKEPPDQNRPLT